MGETATLEKFEVRPTLTQERLREVLSYDPANGRFAYRIRVAQRVRIGDEAGSVNSEGYRHIRVDGRAYKAHRLAFLYMTGEWPADMVDHIDGVRDHNAWANIRPATRSQNLANSTLSRRGKAARKGVRQATSGRWSARIQRDEQARFLGYFPDEASAFAAYMAAARTTFGPYAKEIAA